MNLYVCVVFARACIHACLHECSGVGLHPRVYNWIEQYPLSKKYQNDTTPLLYNIIIYLCISQLSIWTKLKPWTGDVNPRSLELSSRSAPR